MDTATAQSSARGLSEFLVDHERHGEGFDVSHPDGLGNGRIEITCRGCGKAYSYAPGRVRVEREIELEPIRSAPPSSADTTVAGDSARTAPAAKRPKVARWRPRKAGTGGEQRDRLLVFGLIVFAVAAFAFAAYRITGDRSGDSGPTPAAPAAAPPTAGTVESVAGPGYTIVVPAAWSRSDAGGKTVFSGPGGNASIEIFESTNPGLDRSAFAASAAGYLESTPPGGTVGKPGPAGADGKPGFSLVDRGPGGTQKAIGVLSGPRRILVIGTAAAEASRSEATAVDSSLATLSVR
jgi:hypothetical protein